MSPPLIWFMFVAGILSILVAGLYLTPSRLANRSLFFSRRFRLSVAGMLFFEVCTILLNAAEQAWPSVWHNATVADIGLALSAVGVLFVGVSMYPLVKHILMNSSGR